MSLFARSNLSRGLGESQMEYSIGVALLVCTAVLAGFLAWHYRAALFKQSPDTSAEEIPHGNQFFELSEYRATPDQSLVVTFPKRHAPPATRFEDFNQRLFILKPGYGTWPSRIIPNDYPTELLGDLSWAREQIRTRIRPKYPAILDTFGWWAESSSLIELNPYFENPIVAAYLALPIERRPVVISRPRPKDDEGSSELTFFRFQFKDFSLPSTFLTGYPLSMLFEALSSLTGPPQQWWEFSMARARKKVVDLNREHMQEELAERLRAATDKNRFAALWQLPPDPPEIQETSK